MKKIFYLFKMLLVAFFVSSCYGELDNWYSETSDYAGRFVFKIMSEDMGETLLDYGSDEIWIYNTAVNVANEIWFEDLGSVFPLKSKFTLTGNTTSFQSSSQDFTGLNNNIFSTDVLPTPAPTATGQTTQVAGKKYIRAAILEGEILSNAATSIGGNVTDSLYVKIVLYSGTATYESYEISESLRQDPEVAEFAWRFVSATHDSSLDETYVIGGYRYTGMPEDH